MAVEKETKKKKKKENKKKTAQDFTKRKQNGLLWAT